MLQQIDHVNIVVNDLPAMKEFYRDVLGLTVTREVTINGAWIDRTVGLTGVEADVVYLDLEEGPRIELIRYRRPAGMASSASGIPNTAGLRHIAFRVDDLDAAIAQLKSARVKLFSQAQQVPDTQVTYAGGVRKRLVYFLDPENNILELCEYKVAE
jgi:catechol 2,3-dioxygenase-like lactoylglutathione lyase family enzyme